MKEDPKINGASRFTSYIEERAIRQDAAKTQAVNPRSAKCAQAAPMLRRSITHVIGKTVAGQFFIISAHPGVARDFGDDRSSRDGNRLFVAANDGALRQVDVAERHGVNQQ